MTLCSTLRCDITLLANPERCWALLLCAYKGTHATEKASSTQPHGVRLRAVDLPTCHLPYPPTRKGQDKRFRSVWRWSDIILQVHQVLLVVISCGVCRGCATYFREHERGSHHDGHYQRGQDVVDNRWKPRKQHQLYLGECVTFCAAWARCFDRGSPVWQR